jgi:23S rRNA (uracil1939-C5)-methyltransferase
LERIGGLRGISVKPVLGMSDPWRYRNKVQQPVGWSAAKKQVVSGFYRAGSHDLLPIEDCLLQSELSVQLINRTKELLTRYGIRTYDETRHSGWLRHLLVRTNSAGQALLVFVTRAPDFFKEREIVTTLLNAFPALIGVHQNVQPARSNVILGRQWRKIAGADRMEERLGSLKFRLSAGSFFQVNSRQAEALYDTVKRMAGSGQRMLDLYTGVGTIALWLADQFAEVGGIEENPLAIEDANANAELNHIKNARFIAQPVDEFLRGLDRNARGPDLTLVLDPPRAGCEPAVIDAMVRLNPGRIIYVSCDPGTLARDLKLLTGRGFRVDEVQPVDLFPHTPHIETAVKLTKGS